MTIQNTHAVLRDLLEGLECKPGWTFDLEGEDGACRLRITDTLCRDAYQPDRSMPLAHYFPVPVATYNRMSWRRWVFECCLKVEAHELGEWFRDGPRLRPFAPLHGPGEDPYAVHDHRPDLDLARETTQSGTIRPMDDRSGE